MSPINILLKRLQIHKRDGVNMRDKITDSRYPSVALIVTLTQ